MVWSKAEMLNPQMQAHCGAWGGERPPGSRRWHCGLTAALDLRPKGLTLRANGGGGSDPEEPRYFPQPYNPAPTYLVLAGALRRAHRHSMDQQQQDERDQEARSRQSHQDTDQLRNHARSSSSSPLHLYSRHSIPPHCGLLVPFRPYYVPPLGS